MQLDSFYQAPGFLLLAVGDHDERLGCVGVRAIDDRTAEIRRLFVRDAARGTGLGRSLVDRLITDANHAGFDRLVLNTLPAMAEAIGLYRSLGFNPCDPFVEEPLDDTLYFELLAAD